MISLHLLRRIFPSLKLCGGDREEGELSKETHSTEMLNQKQYDNAEGNFEMVLSKSQRKKLRQKHKKVTKPDVYQTRSRAGSKNLSQ